MGDVGESVRHLESHISVRNMVYVYTKPCFLFSICLEEDTDIVVTGGFQAWIGGECVYICLKAIWPSIEERIPNHMAQSTGVTTAQFLGYIIFMVISMPFLYIRPHRIQPLFLPQSSWCS